MKNPWHVPFKTWNKNIFLGLKCSLSLVNVSEGKKSGKAFILASVQQRTYVWGCENVWPSALGIPDSSCVV